jgi:predicted SnoaL-like aldol condensation-catalyzing enzyme
MPRAILPIAVALALVTGFVVSETRQVALAPVDVEGSRLLNRSAEVVRQFYAAANETVGTGELSPLERVVDRDFVDHGALPGVSPDRAGLIAYFTRLHRTAPTLRLVVLDVLAQGNRVAARLRLEGGDDVTFLGLSVAADRFWSGFDVFRLEDDRIVERWADEASLASFDSIVTVTVPVANPTRKALTLQQWTYAPHAAERGSTYLGFAMLVVDRGSLTLELDRRSVTPVRLVPRGEGLELDEVWIEPGRAVELEAGDTLVLPDGSLYELRNDAAAPAVALAVTAFGPLPAIGPGGGLQVPTETSGVTRTVLAGGLSANLPRGEVRVAIGRATLAAWANLPAHQVGVAELIAVEAGDLTLTTTGGTTWASTGPTDGTRRVETARLPAGGGALVGAEATVVYRNATAAPLSVLLVTFGAPALESTPQTLSPRRQGSW